MTTHSVQSIPAIQALVRPVILAAALALAGAVAFGTAQAEELRPIEAKHLELGGLSGVAYYTVQGEGYHLVATLAREPGRSVRFESTLLPGQTVAVSIPGSVGADAETAEFSRRGDRLLVETRGSNDAVLVDRMHAATEGAIGSLER